MKAIVYEQYGSPEVLRANELAKPVPGDDEVLIKIHATPVTAEDTTFRKGDPFIARLFVTGLRRPKYPVLGTEFAGEIEAAGKNVSRFRAGDRVFGDTVPGIGTNAEYILMPENGTLSLKPESLSYAEAAAVFGGFLTALPFLRDKAKIQAGQSVLINGASGSVGTAAIQIAKYYGAEVTAVCSGANTRLVRSLGADHVVDYTKEDFTAASGKYDIIFDAVGKSSYSRCENALSENGIYLTTVPTMGIMIQSLRTSLFGSKKAGIAFTGLRSPEEKIPDLEFLKELIAQGEFTPVIDRRYRLDEAAAAHRYVDGGHKKGNVVLTLETN